MPSATSVLSVQLRAEERNGGTEASPAARRRPRASYLRRRDDGGDGPSSVNGLLAASDCVMAITKWSIEAHKFGALLNGEIVRPTDGQDVSSHPMTTKERLLMIRKSIFAVATVAAIGAAALIPTAASAGGGGKGGGGMGNHGHGHGHGHGHWGGGGFGGGVVVIAPSCWRWVPGVGKVWVCN
jgi:hypothetical protein